MTSAVLGERARVETEVAIALAASWKPFVYHLALGGDTARQVTEPVQHDRSAASSISSSTSSSEEANRWMSSRSNGVMKDELSLIRIWWVSSSPSVSSSLICLAIASRLGGSAATSVASWSAALPGRPGGGGQLVSAMAASGSVTWKVKLSSR
jgi:hypothetical protein